VWFYEEHASRIFTELQAKEAAWRAAKRDNGPGGRDKISGRPSRDRADGSLPGSDCFSKSAIAHARDGDL
jgi:hypothetical protein